MVRSIKEGLIRGPRLLISGKALSQTGGHGDFRTAEVVQPCGCEHSSALTVLVDGVDRVRHAAREQLRQGADQLKIFVSGGVLSPTDPIWMNQFIDDEIRACVEEARSRRTYVMAHAHTAEAARRCVALGVRTIEHGTLLDRMTADAIAASDAFVIPTVAAIELMLSGELPLPPASLEKLQRVAEQAYQSLEHAIAAGVRLGLGTDLFGGLRRHALSELKVRARFQSNLDVLRCATSGNAAAIGRPELGCIRAGVPADLIAIDGDPSKDIDVMLAPERRLPLIVRDGRIVRNLIANS